METFLQFDFSETAYEQPICFTDPIKVIEVFCIEEVPAAFHELEAATQEGYYVAGFVSYEAAPGFDSAFHVHQTNGDFPLVWFGIFENPVDANSWTESQPDYRISDWKLDTDEEEYHQGISSIKQAIEEGNTYQVNYTARLTAQFQGNDYAFYQQLKENQQSAYASYLNIGNYRVLSASPELFFQVSKGSIKTKPMKGTATRGRSIREDEQLKQKLYTSEKDRAENLMIVDLLRNDIGRIARPGTVKVPKLFEVESYPTVHQMTSTVEAELDPAAKIYDWFQALFPCGSITGAPKISTMNYISKLEKSPRHIYCGAIGFITPDKEAIFNVPIRTVLIDKEAETATYGAGGGITWDSTVEGEYEELMAKAGLLKEKRPSFHLLESLKLQDGHYPLFQRHIDRLLSSALYFGFAMDVEKVSHALQHSAADKTAGDFKVRLLVSKSGEVMVETAAIRPLDTVICSLAKTPVDKKNPFLYHKTTHREVYDELSRTAPEDAFSVLLWNEDEELTEFTIGNLVIEKQGKYYTPPIKCGLLAGTFRQELLEQHVIAEQVIHKKDLNEANSIWMINGVRGWIPVQMIR
ncbi:para-aminobenzoate synthetase / 4-amino-4-deoxychorismate lyase [Thalassobacillus cyri]|uniref:Para-aminobenzoate synthetase / 4-amino-4-deoxychorismate lyase n=1 Tax=Thalassobacillus cyri TaxID=571932 RepID=A0A1H3XYJ7_9BACI|nr:aminodeoxychorismate synthase component I [Thalassobacillus cyri]SEA04537.1 para-aminobenzoate synthetase / 4-amino-4-deoxychorismate lyase [Thalassobacillus cyri]